MTTPKLIAGAAALCLSLSACQTTGGGGISIADVQKAAQAACGFLPVAESVAGVLTQDPALATASAVANAICQAVTSSKAASRSATADRVYGTVKGVPIRGEFVR